jgi:hypothetical protein
MEYHWPGEWRQRYYAFVRNQWGDRINPGQYSYLKMDDHEWIVHQL